MKFFKSLDMGLQKIINLGTPTLATDATTKGYVDTADALAVHLAGTETITGAKTFTGGVVANAVSVGTSTYQQRYGFNTAIGTTANITYWKLATLGVTGGGGTDQLQLDLVGGSFTGNLKVTMRLFLSNKSGLAARMYYYGTQQSLVKIVCYLESDTTVSVYAQAPASNYPVFSYNISVAYSGTTYLNPAATTVTPTGTLVYDSSDFVTYPPQLYLPYVGAPAIQGQPIILGNDTRLADTRTPSNDAALVHLAGSETITGTKVFTVAPTVSGQSVILGNDARLTDTRTPSNDADLVHQDGVETITGVKTFSTTPVITNAPVNPTDAANQAYVDLQAISTMSSQSGTSGTVLTFTAHPGTMYFITLNGNVDVTLFGHPAQGSRVAFQVTTPMSSGSYYQVTITPGGSGDTISNAELSNTYVLFGGTGVTFVYFGTSWWPTAHAIGGMSRTWEASTWVDTAPAGPQQTVMLRDDSGRSQVADPSVAADIATKNYVDTTNDIGTYMRKAHAVLDGGGIKADTGTGVSWTTRFITISAGLNLLTATSGYFDIAMPVNGTVVPGVGGAANVTVAGGVIPITGYQSLWYILPLGYAATSLPGNFRIMSYTAPFTVPDNWMLIAHRNGDDTRVKWGDGSGQIVTYYEEVTFPAHTTVAATWKTIIADTRTHLEGPASYNTANGIWTCPVSGLYTLTARICGNNSLTTSNRTIIQFETPPAGVNMMLRDERNLGTNVNIFVTISGDVYFSAGETAMLDIYSNTGVISISAGYAKFHHISFRLISAL